MRLVWFALGLVAVVVGCRGSVNRLYADDDAGPGGGQSPCAGGEIACDSVCTTLASDPRHCGECTRTCSAGEVCGDGRCSATCPEGQSNCNGSCVDLQTDSKSCGVCGEACGANDECVEGKCVIACKAQLEAAVGDPWGWSWDGVERAPSSFNDAAFTCTGFRGRLPTATELHRVSAKESAAVGKVTDLNPLWSLAPAAPSTHVRIRLSDAAVVNEVDATKSYFRCVCPPLLPKVFAGSKCHAAAGENGCATLEGEGKALNVDRKDRPAISKGAAAWECAFYGAHLATTLQLGEAVQQNIGVGSGGFLHSANEVRNDFGALVSWTDGKGFLFQYTGGVPNSLSWSAPTEARPFRCVGESIAPAVVPAVPGQWMGPTRRKTETSDLPAATLIEAVDHCFQNGGHLPTMADLNELVVHGAPNGSGVFVWTSDQTGYDGANFTVAVTKWSGTETSHQYGGADMNWAYKTAKNPYRCVYYPVDASYAGPPASACSGGCATITLPGTSGAKSWLDNMDRDAATTTVAIDTCRKLGGHLPSERDMTEAIRAGLPNGKDVFVQTSDFELGVCGAYFNAPCPASAGAAANIIVGTVKWKDTMPTFDDLWENAPARRADWSWASSANPYRCMWTNELR